MRIDREKYLSFISDDAEKLALKRILDLAEITLNRHIITHSNFLEPNIIFNAKSILNSFDELEYTSSGGFKNPERQIISIYQSYENIEDLDIPIIGLESEIDTTKISHRDILGSVLGLGIVRDKIGDISILDNKIQLVVFSDISDFIVYNLDRIRHEKVDFKKIALNNLEEAEEEYREKFVIVSSMRLDAVISEAFNLSRSESDKFIKSELVKVNYSTISKGHYELKEGDLVSVRRKGRFKIHSIDGLTKKDRVKLTLFFPI